MEPISLRRGFTLNELLVVAAIILALSAIVITSQRSFDQSVTLTNTAYDIALTIRSAQSFGLGSRASGGAINAAYGIHLQNGVDDSFILFSDTSPVAACSNPDCLPGDHAYAMSDTQVQTYTLGNGMRIADFCALVNGAWECAANGLSSLDIIFERPNPDVFMSKNGAYSDIAPVIAACLTIAAPGGGARFLTVGESGQIVANAASDLDSCHE